MRFVSILLLFSLTGANAVCSPVSSIDFEKYTGRWYSVYYNLATVLFSSPKCSTAFYSLNSTSSLPSLTVNNSGVSLKGESTYILGYVVQKDADAAGELTLSLSGVPVEASYRICQLGPESGGQYQWSIVTDDSGRTLYVLARDLPTFFDKYDSNVTDALDGLGYEGPLMKYRANSQDDCPQDIYE